MRKIPDYLAKLRQFDKKNIYIHENELRHLSKRQVEVIYFIATLVSPINVILTSLHMDPTGKPRTTDNGPNHVDNDGIDFVLEQKGQILTYPFYSRNLACWRIAFDILNKFKDKYSLVIVLENNHMHIHFQQNHLPSRVVLQDGLDKVNNAAALPNREFIHNCSNDSNPLIMKDLTQILNLLFN